MKKRIFSLAVVMTCLSILASTTLAYFTDIGTARNVITSSGIDLEILEYQRIDGVLQPWPDEPIPVMPGTTVSKIVSVRNLEEKAWIRMNYSITVYDAASNVMDISAEELARVITITPDSTNWIYQDGWYYYNTALATGEYTEPLFEEVAFSGPYMDNKYQLSTVVIDVNAQAVQHVHNGDNVMAALGWPRN